MNREEGGSGANGVNGEMGMSGADSNKGEWVAMKGLNSAVVVGDTGGVELTTEIVVGRTLVEVSESDSIERSTLRGDGHWFRLDRGSWMGCDLRVRSGWKDS